MHIPTYVNLPSSTYLPLPIPKYQYIIATDLGAGIGLVLLRVQSQTFNRIKAFASKGILVIHPVLSPGM